MLRRANDFANSSALAQAFEMTEPLALVFYQNVIPGSQIVQRLDELSYRVHTVSDVPAFEAAAHTEKPLIVIADLAPDPEAVCASVERLKKDPRTDHLPIIVVLARECSPETRGKAVEAGANLVVSAAAALHHLPILLNQAFETA